MSGEHCKKRVFSGRRDDMRGHVCSRAAVKDGYCAFHHPDAEARRRTEQEEQWAAERKRDEEKWAKQREDARKARSYDALMAYLKPLVTEDLDEEPLHLIAIRAVIQRLEETK